MKYFKNLTANEQEMIIDITEDDMFESGFDSEIWSDYFLEGNDSNLTLNQQKGVLSNLSQKGIVFVSGGGRDSTIQFTDEGIKMLKASGKFDQYGQLV